jgi:hypothetical protein
MSVTSCGAKSSSVNGAIVVAVFRRARVWPSMPRPPDLVRGLITAAGRTAVMRRATIA